VPPLRDDVRAVSWWVVVGLVAGALAGGIVGGVGGRLVMLVLRLASDADGVVSDDGFEIGRFTPGGSFQLYGATATIGAINGVAYVAVRRFLPAPTRVAVWALAGCAIGGSAFVHGDGVDFSVLEPVWLAVVSFVALPGLAALIVAVVVERVAPREPWRVSRWLAFAALPALPGMLVAPVAAVGGAVVVALGRVASVRRRDPRLLQVAVPLGIVVATALAGIRLGQEAAAVL
jgi:hypothetical protein